MNLYNIVFFFRCCFTSTETIRLIRDGEPRTATSTFTQLLSSVRVAQRVTRSFLSLVRVTPGDGSLEEALHLPLSPRVNTADCSQGDNVSNTPLPFHY